MDEATRLAMPLLEVSDLRVHFPGGGGWFGGAAAVRAVDGVSFQIAPGECVGLVGESGSGKSTVGRAVLRLIEPTAGAVRFAGVDVRAARGQGLRALRRQMQIVFQDPGGSLNPRATVGSAIAEPLLVHRLVRGQRERAAAVAEMLERCGMPAAAAGRYPHEFSGGQRQRIAVARALVLRPRLVVCDEPTSALDVSVQAQILNLLKDLQRDLGLAYLFISHDLAVVRHLCDRVAVMRAGRIVEAGPTEQITSRPEHPYTRALRAAVPEADPRRARSVNAAAAGAG